MQLVVTQGSRLNGPTIFACVEAIRPFPLAIPRKPILTLEAPVVDCCIRRDGFAFTQPPRPMRMHGMAVPILDKDRVAGCISMRFPRSAMSETEAGARYGGLLARMTAAIAADLATRRDAADPYAAR
jgi:hypothetical protein